MSRILVTGGAGFLGSNLCRRLIEMEHEVIALDNLYSGRKANLSDILNHKNFNFYIHDVCEPFDLSVDYIFNFASPASPIYYQNDPIGTFKTNILGTYNALELATKRNAVVIQASTSEIYGDPTVSPQKETYWGHVNPIGLRSCYDEGKRGAETLCFDFNRLKDVDVRIVRIFNTYGPGMRTDDGRVITNFLYNAYHNRPISLYGDGSQTRSFCYVDDLINVIIRIAFDSRKIFGPFNIGNPNEFTILELAQLVIKSLNSTSKLEFQKLPEDDPKQRKPDISKVFEIYGWKPEIELQTGLLKTVESLIANKFA